MEPKKIKWSQLAYHWEIYLLILPTLVLIGLFQYYPAASGIYHSLFRWNGADVSEWVGLKNYHDMLFGSKEFWASFKVAFTLGVWNVVKMIPAIAVAVWIHRCSSARTQFFYRLMFIVPMVVPGLVIALIWRTFFFEANAGYLNLFLESSGIMDLLIRVDSWFGWGGIFVEGKRSAWLGDPRLILTACIVWGFPWVGSFAVLTHLAKLQNIPKEIYEASEIDGAGWWAKFSRIELPLIMGSIYLMLVFVIIGTIKDAGMILALAGLDGGPGGKVTVPALFMLRKAFVSQEMGAACAIGIILTMVVILLQKLSTIVMGQESNSAWKSRLLRPVVLVAGAALIYFPAWYFIGALLVALSLPWGWLIQPVVQWWGRQQLAKEYAAPVKRGEPAAWVRWLEDKGLRAFKHAAIWAVLLFAFLPFYLMVVVSFKTNTQFYDSPASITTPLHGENWTTAWELIRPSIANSLWISTAGTFLTMVFGLGGAYFFARMRVPLSAFFWNAILILMMMPTVANLVPLFRLLADLNLLNTLTALILVGTSGGQIFAIFVLRNFVADIPQDLFEAAEIDGANHFQQLYIIVLPLCGPILGTVGVMHFISEWNEFVLPLIVMRDAESLPVMVQLQRLSGEYIKFFGPLMAGYALASIPVIVLFAFSMKLFVRGMTDGAVKG